MGYKNLIRLDECLSIKRDKFSSCYIDYIPPEIVFDTKEYFKWGRCGMCSGFFTGNAEYMYKVCDLIENKFLEYLEKGYGHADEQLYSPVYFENKDLFEHYYGDYQQMITNYVYIYDFPEAPINNFINKSFLCNNLEKCIEECEFVLRSYKLGKCVINNIMLEKLYDYYIKSKFNIFNEYYFNNNYLSEDDESNLCNNIIKKYLDSSNNLECYKYSTKFIKLLEKDKIKNYKIYFMVMFMQYISSYYIDKKNCKKILANIYINCANDENFKKEYESNKIFYDEQFRYINVIYCFWTGSNEMSENRKVCLEQLRNTSECEVILVTNLNLHNYILPDKPLHQAYEFLSETHKADYLRTYFMNFYGGGYSDIKKTTGSWKELFTDLYTSNNSWICGYPEICDGVAYHGGDYKELIGNCAYISKPNTALTNEWYNEMIELLDKKLLDLKLNPSKHPQDCKEHSNYPIGWNEMLGQIFHKICTKYKNYLLKTLPISVFYNYR